MGVDLWPRGAVGLLALCAAAGGLSTWRRGAVHASTSLRRRQAQGFGSSFPARAAPMAAEGEEPSSPTNFDWTPEPRDGDASEKRDDGRMNWHDKRAAQLTKSLWRDAAVAEQAGRFAEAASLYNRWMALGMAHNVGDYRRLAKLHSLNGDRYLETMAYKRGVEAFPLDSDLWRGLAFSSDKTGDLAGARSFYAKALELNPRNFAAWDSWSRMELSQKRPKIAAALAWRGLERAGAVQPLTEKADDGGGRRSRDGNTTSATTKERPVLVADPPPRCRLWHAYAMAVNKGGGVDRATGRPMSRDQAAEAAEAAMRQGLGCNPQHAHLRHALGVQLFAKGDVDGARHELQYSCDLGGQIEAASALGRLEEVEGRVPQARAAYRLACAHRRAGISQWRSWARFEERCGDGSAARKVYREASVRFPRDVELHVQWARLELKHSRDPRFAREALKRALRNSPGSVRAHHALADFEATHSLEFEDVDIRVAALHVARRTYYRGAKQSNGGRPLVVLVISWAHTEWALAKALGDPEAYPDSELLNARCVRQSRRLFAWAAKLANDDVQTKAWTLLGRARLEVAVLKSSLHLTGGVSRGAERNLRAVARHFAAHGLQAARKSRDLATAARCWDTLADLEDGATALSDKKRRAFSRRGVAAETAHRYNGLAAGDHPLKRRWTEPAPPMETVFGCVQRHPTNVAPQWGHIPAGDPRW